jgi:hypothetical protein
MSYPMQRINTLLLGPHTVTYNTYKQLKLTDRDFTQHMSRHLSQYDVTDTIVKSDLLSKTSLL